MNRDWLKNFESNQRITNLLSYLLLAAMLGSLTAIFAQLGEQAFQWQVNHLPWLCAFITLEAIYTANLLRQRITNALDREWWLYRITEWLTIAILLKFGWYLFAGLDMLWQDFQSWPDGFFASFFNREYVTTLVPAFVAWVLATLFVEDLRVMQSSETDLEWERMSEMEMNRTLARKMMMSRIFLIGTFTIIATALTRFFLQRASPQPLALKNPLFFLLLYFSLAFLFLSMTYFSVLRARWLWQQIPINPQVARMWFRYGLIFFILILAISIILPSQYSLGFLDALRYLIWLVGQALTFVVNLFIVVIQFIISAFSWLVSLFTKSAPQELTPSPLPTQPTPIPPPTTAPPASGISYLDLIKAILFWGLFLAIAIFGIDYFIRQNTELIESLKKFRVLAWLAQGFAWLNTQVRALNKQVGETLKNGVERVRQIQLNRRSRSRWRFVNPRRLPPRERSIFYYLTLVRRGGEKGMPRRNSQTALQYTQKLLEKMPEADQDLETMTDTFIEARYSQHVISDQQVSAVRQAWGRVRRALQIWRDRAGKQG